MKLLHLKIENFRSFGEKSTEEKMVFKDGVNLIVGENNVGKSNLLRAFEVFKEGYSPDKNDWYAGHQEKEFVIELEVELSSRELRVFLKDFMRPKYIRDATKTKRIIKDLGRKVWLIFSSRRGRFVKIKELYIKGSGAKLNSDFSSSSYEAIDWFEILDKYFNTIDFSIFTVIKERIRGDKERRIQFKKNLDNSFFNLLAQKLKNFSEVRQRPRGKNQKILESYDGSQVADVLATLKMGNRQQRKKFELIKQEFTKLFPTLRLEVTEEKTNQPPIIVVEKIPIEYEVPIDRVGAGIGEMAILLTHLIASEEMIFGLDMPELHLHPHSQRLLLGILKEYSKNNQVLIVTHSPLFLESKEIDNIVIVREQKGATIVTQLPENYFDKEERIKLQRHLDASNKEFFFSRASLVVEGETEVGAMPIFSKALGKDFDIHGISLVRAGKHFGIFIKLLRGLKFPYFVMCDKDALMNIEESIEVNKRKIRTSPVFYNLSKINLLQEEHKKRILEFESEISSISGKEVYDDKIFNGLSAVARVYDVYVLPSDFEGVLRRSGYEKSLKKAETISDSKVTRGRFIAEEILRQSRKVPTEFVDVINAIITRASVNPAEFNKVKEGNI